MYHPIMYLLIIIGKNCINVASAEEVLTSLELFSHFDKLWPVYFDPSCDGSTQSGTKL